MKLTILVAGLSPDRVPIWEDVEFDVKLGLPWDPLWYQYDILFEMHDRELWETRGVNYVRRLQGLQVPILMQEAHSDIPHGEPFWPHPSTKGAPYYNSSIAYMLAEVSTCSVPTHVYITGVALADHEEYSYQRANIEYWIGVLEGKGHKVHIYGDSCLMKFHSDIMFDGVLQTYEEGIYGRLRRT